MIATNHSADGKSDSLPVEQDVYKLSRSLVEEIIDAAVKEVEVKFIFILLVRYHSLWVNRYRRFNMVHLLEA